MNDIFSEMMSKGFRSLPDNYVKQKTPLDEEAPVVSKYYVEFVSYPKSGRMFTKWTPLGMNNKSSKGKINGGKKKADTKDLEVKQTEEY